MLKAYRVPSIGALLNMSDIELLSLRNVGKRTLQNIDEALAEEGLSRGSHSAEAPRAWIQKLLRHIGDDPDREGLQATPDRVLKFLRDFCTPKDFRFTTFDSEGYDEMIVQTDIPFFSLCEHHMLPFFGRAHVGYIPKERIVGLSKLARAVRYCSAGLQNQERVTHAVGQMIEDQIQPLGVGVVLEARHLCMEMRGVNVHDTWTTTSRLTGPFRGTARAEFLSFVHRCEKQ